MREILDSHTHATLRMAPPRTETRLFVQIVTAEFESAAARFPLLFSKNAETGAFYAGAMLGFRPGQPLFQGALDRHDVQRLFDVEREGFYVADAAIAIDRDHERFADPTGAPLFDDEGRPGDSLRRIQGALGQLKLGLDQTDQFIRALLTLKLIEPIDLSFSFDDGDRLTLEGLYTISRDALAALDDNAVLDLFRRGYLGFAQIMIGSLQQIPRLARLHNERLSGA